MAGWAGEVRELEGAEREGAGRADRVVRVERVDAS